MAIEKENVLTKNAFDPIIANLELLRTEIQGYRNDLDGIVENLPELVNLAGSTPQMLAIEQVLGQLLSIESEIDKLLDIYTDLQALGDIHTSLPALNDIHGSLAGLNSIASALPELSNIEGNLPALVAIEGSLPMLNALEQALPEITAVHSNLPSINSVAGIESEIQAIAGNIQAILDAPTHAQTAVDAKEGSEEARDDAQTWAEGDDPAVELLGGTHSAKTWAELSEQHTREGIRFLGTVDDLENLPPDPDDGDAYFYAETVGDNAIGYGVVWSESAAEWIIFQMGATLIPGTMLPDQEAAPAAANQTTFGGFSANPAMSLVMINRIEQESDTYTFDGNQIVFNEGLSAGDIVRVRQWRTQVSFEDLPDVETLGAEDKIPVQTSQGSGVIDFPELIFQRQKLVYTKDFMPFEGREQVEGSASIGQFNSGFDYYKRIQMGEVAESRALYMNPLRHGLFNALISSGRQSIDFNKRIQFIQHLGVKTWTSTGEVVCSFGRRYGSGRELSDSGERMFGFSIKSNLEGVAQLYLRTNNAQTEPADILAGDIDMDTIDGIYQMIMDWAPGGACGLVLR